MKIIKIFFAFFTLFVTLLPASIVFAAPCVGSGPFDSGQICYDPLTNIPGISQINGSGNTTIDGSDNPAAMVTSFYKFAIGIASVGAVIMIMWGGFEYMTTEAFTGKSNAKNRITYALVGLILLLSSYIILRTINKDLVTFKITLPQGDTFLSDAAAKQAAAQQKIDDVTSLTSKINREINEKRQTMVQDQAVLDGLKKELASNTDPEKAIIIQKQIDEAQQTFNQSERVFNETVIAGQKEVSRSGIAAYVDAGDYTRALTYTSMQEKATARELEMLKNDPVNGEDALKEKQNAEIANASEVNFAKHKLEVEATELKEKLTKINEQIIIVQNDKNNSEEEKKVFLADLEKEKVSVQTKINTNQENLTETEKEWKEADDKLSAVNAALKENKKKVAVALKDKAQITITTAEINIQKVAKYQQDWQAIEDEDYSVTRFADQAYNKYKVEGAKQENKDYSLRVYNEYITQSLKDKETITEKDPEVGAQYEQELNKKTTEFQNTIAKTVWGCKNGGTITSVNGSQTVVCNT